MAEPATNPEQATQKVVPKAEPTTPPPSPAPSGKWQAFQDLKLELTDADLANPGTQKLILDRMIRAEIEKDEAKTFVTKYYDAELRAATLSEKLNANRLNECQFALGLGVGFAIIGLAPFFWTWKPFGGVLCLIVGGILVGASTIFRALFK